MKKYWPHFPWLLVLTLVVIFLTRHLWSTRAWIETHDGIFHLIRQEVFTDMFRAGHFPVRWAGTLDNGFGIPLFNYIYPGPYYVGLPLSLLGLSSKWVIKLVEIGFYFLGSLGIYLLFARKNRALATALAIFYLTTPYLLLDLFVRGALGELMGISLLPWTLLAAQDLQSRGKLSWYHPLPYFGLLISHNFLGFLFLPLYAVATYLARSHWRKVISSLFLSLGISAFFVLPMIFERNLLLSVTNNNFTYQYADHFVSPIQFIWGKWGIGHSYAGVNDGISFALGFSSLVILLLTLIAVIKRHEIAPKIWLGVTVLTLFFITPWSQFIWDLLPPLQMIQFPWRLLSFMPLLIPLLGSYVFRDLRSRGLILALLVVSLYFGYRYSTPSYFQNNEQLAQQLYIHRNQTTTSSRLEILPRWVGTEERWRGDENIRIQTNQADLVLLFTSPLQLDFSSTANDPTTTYLLRRNYFPSWVVRDETGRVFSLSPSLEGEILFHPKIGTHTYRLSQQSTPIELWSNVISLFSLFLLSALAIRPRLKRYLDTHFDGWDISIALRYLPIVDALKKHAQSGDTILEVGSEIHGITTYYHRSVTGLDQRFDYTRQNKYLKPVIGSATHLPFKAQSFSYVISVDCLEHIPPNLRTKAVTEMLRVASKQIYLTFPVGPRSEGVDQSLNQYFYAKNKKHFPYLVEHIENGLPGFDFIKSIVAKHKAWHLRVVGNTSTWLWVILLKMGFSNIQWQTSIYRRLLLLIPILKHFNFGPCYRQLYILTRIKS